MKLKLGDMVRKIARHNWKKYMLFCISIVFAVSMVGAFGILLFSSTVTNVLKVLGSTFTIALALYAVTVVGLVIFALYAHNVYVKYKMDEIGVFLSLGLKPSDVQGLMNREFCGLYGVSAVIGLLLALPLSFLSWSFLTLFISTTETAFTIGWVGYVVAIIYVIIVACVLLYKNSRIIRNIEVIQILKMTTTNETVKGAGFVPGLLGLICVPVGVVVFWVMNSMGNLSNSYTSLSGIGLVLSGIGLYFFIAYITSIGDFFKRFKRPYYLKNLLFFNLVKQKGKQYTLSLFISTLLIAIAIFGICFNSVSFVANYYQIVDDTFGYALLVPDAHAESLNARVLGDLAAESDIEISDMKELELLFVGRQHMYGEGKAEWGEEYCISASNFNVFADSELAVEPGFFLFFSDMIDTPALYTLSKQDNNFYIPTGKTIFQMDLQDTVLSDAIVNSSGAVTTFVILNDSDYENIRGTLESKYKYSYYLWNADAGENADLFFNAMRDVVVQANEGQYMVNLNTQPIRELMRQDGKDVPLDDVYKPYRGNELDAARNWELYPFSKDTSADALLETGAVYLLLMFFIAIISFVSATMIIGLRVINTIWQDEATYKKAEFLGEKASGLKRLVTKQMALIFFFPVAIGSLLSIFIINRMVDLTSAAQYSGTITMIGVALSLIAIVVDICVFFALRRKMCREIIH